MNNNYNSEEPIRVQKLCSNFSNYSRREIESLIRNHRVYINGHLAQLGDKATRNDSIMINGKDIQFYDNHQYYVLNKPRGFISSRFDSQGQQVISLIPNWKVRNLFTIGRLDVDTRGLIIVTSDGHLSQSVNLPRNKVSKTYLVTSKRLTSASYDKLKNGIVLENGFATMKPVEFKLYKFHKDLYTYQITITEGKNNQIKRMWKSANSNVIYLERIQIGNIKLLNLKLGDYREYTKSEIYGLLNIEY